MYRYTKNIYLSLISAFSVITTFVLTVSWIVQSIKHLELISSKGAQITSFLMVTLYLVPFLLFITIPISLILSIYYVYKKFIHDKEIIVLLSIGLKKIDIIKHFLIFTLLVIFLHYLVSLYLLPMGYKNFKRTKSEIEQNSITNLLQVNTFIHKIRGVTIYIEKKEQGLLKNIFLFDSRNPKKSSAFIADQAKFHLEDGKIFMNLKRGSKIDFLGKKKQYSLIKFSQYNLEITLQQKELEDFLYRDPNSLYVKELLSLSNDSKNLTKMKSHGYFRLLWPYSAFTLVLIILYSLNYSEKPSSVKLLASIFIVFSVNIGLYILSRNNLLYIAIMALTNAGSQIYIALSALNKENYDKNY